MQSDERLTELARSGHEPAFAAIVQRYRPALVRYGTGLLGRDRAEDAVQQALANAHAALTRPGDDRPIQLRPWLYRVTHNAALNVLRAGTGDALPTPDELAGGETPHEVLARREQLDDLLRAIGRLPAGQRDALLLRELEGRSHEEIAEVLGLTRGAARQQLFRARAAVRAACTAITPAPLLARLLELASSAPAAGDAGSQLLAGAMTKATVGIVALGAAGGAVTTGVVRHHHDAAPARAAVVQTQKTTAARPAAFAPAALTATPTSPVSTPSSGGGSDRSGSGRGSHDDQSSGDRSGSGSGSGHDGGEVNDNRHDSLGESGRSGSGESGQSDHGEQGRDEPRKSESESDRSTSGTSGSSGRDERGRSGGSGTSGRGEDSRRSGSGKGDGEPTDQSSPGRSGSASSEPDDLAAPASGSGESQPSGSDDEPSSSGSGSSGSGSSGSGSTGTRPADD